MASRLSDDDVQNHNNNNNNNSNNIHAYSSIIQTAENTVFIKSNFDLSVIKDVLFI
jgi:hypothetical protein